VPDAQGILTNLRLIANDRIAVAVAWHVAVALCGLALVLGWRPSRRVAGLMLSAPVASVGVVAALHGNPFNGAMFGAITAVLVGITSRIGPGEVQGGATADRIVGALMIAFAWLYPHFLEARPAVYLYAAPMGLIPCPTLALVIGFALVSGGLASRAWSLTLTAAGLFYGLFGVFRLGVRLDLFLVAGAMALLLSTLRLRRARTETLSAPLFVSHSK
jgi:hypothetical protein